MTRFLTDYRTRISQFVGALFVLLDTVSGKLLPAEHAVLSGTLFLLGCIGVGLCTESLVLTLLLGALYALEYPLVIRSEEARLTRLFGAEYGQYVREVPRFLPDLSLYHEPADYVVKPKVFRHAVRDVMWFIFAVGILECIEGIQEAGLIPALLQLY